MAAKKTVAAENENLEVKEEKKPAAKRTRATSKQKEDKLIEQPVEQEAPMNADEELAKKVTGRKKGSEKVEKASKTGKAKLYRSEHVFTEFGEDEIETESTKQKEDYLDLVESSKSKIILRGTIIGYHYAGEEAKSTLLAEVAYGHATFKVYIPSYLLFDYEISDYIEPDKIRNIENEINRRIGSEVSFIAAHVNEKEKKDVFSRLT